MVSGLHYDNKMPLNESISNSFGFRKKNSRLDWRKLAAVDLDRVALEIDIFTLQDNIDHITYCNIDAELDTRMMDPNYIKLFKLSQFMIEYLVHSQGYLTDVIGNIENQLNGVLGQNEEFKKLNEKIQKELTEVKKENKKRKKMIETQQTLMSVTSANYHQCAFCSKVFLNVNYLQAHMTRRHPDVDHSSVSKQALEFEKELERIKERLRITESELIMERNLRLSGTQKNVSNTDEVNVLLKKIEDLKNNEIRQQKDEYDKNCKSLKKKISDLEDKNSKFGEEIKNLQEKLGKKSSIGWMKDDVDLEKDSVLKMKKEVDRLKELIANYEQEIKNLNNQISKLKKQESILKNKHQKEIKEKEEEISRLKEKLEELKNTIGKSDNELQTRIQQIQDELQFEQQLRQKLESDLKNRPPTVTPRQQPNQVPAPVPSKKLPTQPVKNMSKSVEIYLPQYCPITLRKVQSNPSYLDSFKKSALEAFEKELDDLGINVNETRLSNQDFKLVMNKVKNLKAERTDDLVKFNEVRKVLNEICFKHASQRVTSSIRSSRVHFKSDVTSKKLDDLEDEESTWIHDSVTKSRTKNDQGEETDEDVSVPNAFESDDDDTEPTKSILQEQKTKSRGSVSPRKGSRLSNSLNFDETSDFENVSQLTESYRKNRSPSKKLLTSSQAKSSVNDLKKKLEKQLEESARKGYKPSANAVPVGFREGNDDENSLGTVSELDEYKSPRPRSAVRSSIQDSNSSGLWIGDSHSMDPNPQILERPPTANSSKTLNDTDEITNID
ncbi:zinc finger DZIP1L-like isoform X1 [Brachionus plicatilis]|uniref:Zinc finger DZIP1L-like isoform X1 n=1 Tax=Brachionus plicatilis TaxID=10195 RepID=A0A3M7PE74_BRAPC|nr:zinc finger DZIP1L-like isoform X1 [Brachionus plicatilis]